MFIHLISQIYLAIVALAQKVRSENGVVTHPFDFARVISNQLAQCFLGNRRARGLIFEKQLRF
jgi:hypothetical protein